MEQKRNLVILALFLTPVVIVGSFIAWMVWGYVEGKQKDETWRQKTGLNQICQVVISDRDIKEGDPISYSDVYEKEMDPESIGRENLLCKEYAIGKQVKYGIEAGQIISAFDLVGWNEGDLDKIWLKKLDKSKGKGSLGICLHDPNTKVFAAGEKVFRAKRDIKADELVREKDVELAPLGKEENNSFYSDLRLLAGHTAKYAIDKGKFISSSDFYDLGDSKQVVFVAARNIKAGEKISNDLYKVATFEPNEYPVNALLDEDLIYDRKAIQDIGNLQVIRSVDVAPLSH